MATAITRELADTMKFKIQIQIIGKCRALDQLQISRTTELFRIVLISSWYIIIVQSNTCVFILCPSRVYIDYSRIIQEYPLCLFFSAYAVPQLNASGLSVRNLQDVETANLNKRRKSAIYAIAETDWIHIFCFECLI